MYVTFITSTSYLDTSLPLINELCKKIKINVIINFSQNTKNVSIASIKGNFHKNMIIYDQRKIFEILSNSFSLFKNLKKVNFILVYWHTLKQLDLKNIYHILKLRHYINGDLVINQIHNAHYYLLLKYVNSKPVIIDIHDPIEHSGQKPSIGLKIFLKKWTKYAKQIIIHNRSNINEFAKRYKIRRYKIKYCGFGVIPLINPSINKICYDKIQKNTILFFGRISQYKGVEYLIEAAKIARKKITNLKVVIAGSGQLYFDISDIKHNSTFQIINRYIPNSELAQLIQESSIVVCPYTDATQSGVVMTAYAFNKPVIATKVGGLAEAVSHNITGKLVLPKDPKSLSEAIIELLKNPDKIDKMSKNIELFCTQGEFSWENIAQKTIEVYKKTLNKG